MKHTTQHHLTRGFQSMGAAPKYMGYVMAGYALGGIISAPLYGYIG